MSQVTTIAGPHGAQETPEQFRIRARAWIEANLQRGVDERERDHARDAALQRKIYDGGFAGIATPKAYGGLGLTLDHQRVWAEETAGYRTPNMMVCLGMMLPTLLDH